MFFYYIDKKVLSVDKLYMDVFFFFFCIKTKIYHNQVF